MQAANMGIQKQTESVETFLIHRARKGDLVAFNRLVMDYQDTAYNLAYYLLGNEKAAEAATEAAMGNAYRNIGGFPGKSFRAWVLRCVLAACQERYPWLSIRDYASGRVTQKPEDCLESLTPELRVLVLLVDVEGLSYAETAWIVGKPLELVRARLAEARLRIGEAAGQSG